MCSFQKPEPHQPSHAWPMPPNVPSPEDCELQEIVWARRAAEDGMDERIKRIYQTVIEVGKALRFLCLSYSSKSQERTKSPIAWKIAKEHHIASDGSITYMYWMSARNLGSKYGVPFQKVFSVDDRLRIVLTLKILTVHCCLLVGLEFYQRWDSHTRTEEIWQRA